MQYKNDVLSAQFTVPDQITVRQQLRYASTLVGNEKEALAEKYFDAAKILVQDWQCERWPDIHKINIDIDTDPALADLIFWVAFTCVRKHVENLESLPKNL